MQTCTTKSTLGLDCMGCGMQRSIIALLKGHVWESIQLYPALIPLTAMFLLLIVHSIFKLKYGARVLLILFILNAALMFGNFLYKYFTQLGFI